MSYMEDYEDYIELDTISYSIYEETVNEKDAEISKLQSRVEELEEELESICRARRTIVKNYPELNASIEIRMEEEQKYIEFAREN